MQLFFHHSFICHKEAISLTADEEHQCFFFSYLPPKTECSFVMDDRRIQTTNPYKLQALFENQFF